MANKTIGEGSRALWLARLALSVSASLPFAGCGQSNQSSTANGGNGAGGSVG